MIVLGLNAFGHDAAAVLLVDGRPVFAASEERFDRRRHSAAFPALALRAALDTAGVMPRDVEVVAFPWTRGMARGRKALYVLRHLPQSRAFLTEDPEGGLPGRKAYLESMRRLPDLLREEGLRCDLVRIPHHRAHAASASLTLPDGLGAVLTADGMGEWTTAAAWEATAEGLRRGAHAVYPHSAGKAYSAVTQWLGFRPESGEGKTMGLAPLGDPNAPGARFARGLLRPSRRRIVEVDVRRFGFPWGHRRLFGRAFEEVLGTPRHADEELREGDADVARGIQEAVERVALEAAQDLLRRTHARTLSTAGGLFLNCAVNGRLQTGLDVPVLPFPVAGDAGAAWGAAALAHQARTGRAADPLETLFLGHVISESEARETVGGAAERPEDLGGWIADRVAAGRLVGVAAGRAEFGPRALGARSILASPRTCALRDRLNEHKGREAWRPLAPVVRERERTLFEDLTPSPWMILTYTATPEGRASIPGGIHVDGTARVQTVSDDDETLLGPVIDALTARGEPPAVLNTSFNRRGEPIVNTAAEALASARAMRLDAVVIAGYALDLTRRDLPHDGPCE